MEGLTLDPDGGLSQCHLVRILSKIDGLRFEPFDPKKCYYWNGSVYSGFRPVWKAPDGKTHRVDSLLHCLFTKTTGAETKTHNDCAPKDGKPCVNPHHTRAVVDASVLRQNASQCLETTHVDVGSRLSPETMQWFAAHSDHFPPDGRFQFSQCVLWTAKTNASKTKEPLADPRVLISSHLGTLALKTCFADDDPCSCRSGKPFAKCCKIVPTNVCQCHSHDRRKKTSVCINPLHIQFIQAKTTKS